MEPLILHPFLSLDIHKRVCCLVFLYFSSGHISFIEDVAATQPPQHLHYLLKMLPTRGIDHCHNNPWCLKKPWKCEVFFLFLSLLLVYPLMTCYFLQFVWLKVKPSFLQGLNKGWYHLLLLYRRICKVRRTFGCTLYYGTLMSHGSLIGNCQFHIIDVFGQ